MTKKLPEGNVRKKPGPAKGTRPKNLDSLHEAQRGASRPELQGERNPGWKGEDAAYGSKHMWASRKFGKPSQCEKCGTEDAGRYEWHNLSGEYKRVREDWQRLCVSCHRKLTFAQEGYEPWNKGEKIQTNTGRTHIKPGQHISPETEFKPGLAPHNKYLEPRLCAQCNKEFQPREANRKFCCYRCYWNSLKKPKS